MAFAPDAPDMYWVADITQHGTLEGRLYCAVVVGVFARPLAGGAMGERITTRSSSPPWGWRHTTRGPTGT